MFMSYKPIYTLEALQSYLTNATHAAFDIETAPDNVYRREEKAALDAHKSRIVGMSFSVSEGDGVYLPLTHIDSINAADPYVIWN
jgi:DNA polymerase-1